MIDDPWIWLSAAVVFVVLEMALSGYVLLGFGVGAAVVGVLLALGGPFAGWIAGSGTLLLLTFAVVSALAWLMLRRWLSGGTRTVRRIDKDINDN